MSAPTHEVSDATVEKHINDKHLNPDALEVAPGTAHEQLEGYVPTLASDAEIHSAFEKAFDYRGDVTITKKDGSKLDGYIFDRHTGASLADSFVRVFPANSPPDSNEKVKVAYSDIAALAFTGRDTAAGKSYEAWVRKFREKKAAGEKNIGIDAESLE